MVFFLILKRSCKLVERTSLPVFLIFSRRSLYGIVPVTSTNWVSRSTLKESTPYDPILRNLLRIKRHDYPPSVFLRTRSTAPEQPLQVIWRSRSVTESSIKTYLVYLDIKLVLLLWSGLQMNQSKIGEFSFRIITMTGVKNVDTDLRIGDVSTE
jgi:hypothetical protein